MHVKSLKKGSVYIYCCHPATLYAVH